MRGFTLVEALVATLVTLVVVGTIAAAVGPAQQIFHAQPEVSDLQQRLRVVTEGLRRDLAMAGAGTYTGPVWGTLGNVVAPVMPYQAFGDAPDPARGVYFRPDAVSFLYVPQTPSQTALAAALPSGSLTAQLAQAPNCPSATVASVCGFAAGDRLLVTDREGRWDIYTADQVVAGALLLTRRAAPSPSTYPTGSSVAEVKLGTYHLRTDTTAGTAQLMRHDGWATDLPVVDDVVQLGFRYFGVAEPPRLTGAPLDSGAGPWTSYGPAPPALGTVRGAWPAGENCTFAAVAGVHQSRLATLGAGEIELAEAALTDGPWCPDSWAPNRFDADLLRVRRVQVRVRVQTESASFRGPAGILFLNGGTARAGHRVVPDLEIEFSVTPRNLSLER